MEEEEAGEDGEDGPVHVLGWGDVEQSGSGERRTKRRRRRRGATGGGPRKSQELFERHGSMNLNPMEKWFLKSSFFLLPSS